MIGTVWWNVIGGMVTFIFTFGMSIRDNLLVTSLLKGLYSGAILFVLIYVVRFVLGLTLHQAPRHAEPTDDVNETTDDSVVGRHLDLTTPNDPEDSNPSSGMAFSPLVLPKIESKPELNTEDLVRAIRHIAEDERG